MRVCVEGLKYHKEKEKKEGVVNTQVVWAKFLCILLAPSAFSNYFFYLINNIISYDAYGDLYVANWEQQHQQVLMKIY